MDAVTKSMIEKAIAIRERAYAPYSKFKVGAALKCRSGEIFTGCNVENGVLGLSICAERVAITRAISEGFQEFDTIVIAASPLATPCGSCRQFMVEFQPDIKVIAVDSENPALIKETTAAELLPDFFRLAKE